MGKDNLLKKIEFQRNNLYCLLSINPPTHKEVVNCSQELDRLIAEYQKSLS